MKQSNIQIVFVCVSMLLIALIVGITIDRQTKREHTLSRGQDEVASYGKFPEKQIHEAREVKKDTAFAIPSFLRKGITYIDKSNIKLIDYNYYPPQVKQLNSITVNLQGNAIELVYEVPIGTTIENIEKTLQDLGIEGSSFKFDEGTISITAFSKDEALEIIDKFSKNTSYGFKEYNEQNSRYLDNRNRQDTYRLWLNSQEGKQNRSLYNACSKALTICEATEKVEESQRLHTAQMAGEKWNQEHGISQKPVQETQRTISYTPKGKRTQVYTIEGTHIYNRDGKEVYIKDSVDRNKIYANLAVKDGRCRCIFKIYNRT